MVLITENRKRLLTASRYFSEMSVQLTTGHVVRASSRRRNSEGSTSSNIAFSISDVYVFVLRFSLVMHEKFQIH